jgi:hypothetical protein
MSNTSSFAEKPAVEATITTAVPVVRVEIFVAIASAVPLPAQLAVLMFVDPVGMLHAPSAPVPYGLVVSNRPLTALALSKK